MRLAAQFKMGFYAADPLAVAMVAERLRAPSGPFVLLDPCAGEGWALYNLGQSLNAAPENLFAVELDENRAAKVHENLPGSRVLAPASAFGVKVGWSSVSGCWLNPPFDDELGGGQRTETQFLRKFASALPTGGVLMFVCPRHVLAGYADHFTTDAARFLVAWFENLSLMEFPEEVRPYQEVVVLATKRKMPLAKDDAENVGWADVQAPEGFVYHLPSVEPRPEEFVKTEPTEMELRRMLQASPLRKMLESTPEKELGRPLLPVNDGHRAMLLAAGHLDGVVAPKDEPAHVVRGTAKKEEHIVSETETEDEDGNVNTKTVYGERVKLVVRVVNDRGELHTLQSTEEGGDDVR